jgi:hypothetical protein
MANEKNDEDRRQDHAQGVAEGKADTGSFVDDLTKGEDYAAGRKAGETERQAEEAKDDDK